MLRKLSTLILLTFALAIVPAAAHAVCPGGQFYVDLKTGVTSPMAGVSFTALPVPVVPVTAACPLAAGWKMAAVKIVVPAGCTQANVVVEYEGLPSAWTVDLGDSPTNDGFGGDAGSNPPYNAELQILAEDLAVYNGSANPALVDNLAIAHLALTDSALKFVVKDQFVSWGNPHTILQTPKNKILFSFTDPKDPRTIYLGLNRVISGPGARTGCGARRTLITFQ